MTSPNSQPSDQVTRAFGPSECMPGAGNSLDILRRPPHLEDTMSRTARQHLFFGPDPSPRDTAGNPVLDGRFLDLLHDVEFGKLPWWIIPAAGKVPLVKFKERFENGKPFSYNEICDAIDSNPKATGGLTHCGKSGLVVIDTDNDEADKALRAYLGNAVSHVYVKTRKGRHYYYKRPPKDKVPEIRNRVGLLGQRIDLRGDSGLVVTPWSLSSDFDHVYTPSHWPLSGEVWESIPEFDPLWFPCDTGPTESSPAERAAQLQSVKAAVRDTALGDPSSILASRWLQRNVPSLIPEGSRDTTLFQIACSLYWGFGLSDHEVLQALHSINQSCCTPPLSAKQVADKLLSAKKYGKEEPGKRLEIERAIAKREADEALGVIEIVTRPQEDKAPPGLGASHETADPAETASRQKAKGTDETNDHPVPADAEVAKADPTRPRPHPTTHKTPLKVRTFIRKLAWYKKKNYEAARDSGGEYAEGLIEGATTIRAVGECCTVKGFPFEVATGEVKGGDIHFACERLACPYCSWIRGGMFSNMALSRASEAGIEPSQYKIAVCAIPTPALCPPTFHALKIKTKELRMEYRTQAKKAKASSDVAWVMGAATLLLFTEAKHVKLLKRAVKAAFGSSMAKNTKLVPLTDFALAVQYTYSSWGELSNKKMRRIANLYRGLRPDQRLQKSNAEICEPEFTNWAMADYTVKPGMVLNIGPRFRKVHEELGRILPTMREVQAKARKDTQPEESSWVIKDAGSDDTLVVIEKPVPVWKARKIAFREGRRYDDFQMHPQRIVDYFKGEPITDEQILQYKDVALDQKDIFARLRNTPLRDLESFQVRPRPPTEPAPVG